MLNIVKVDPQSNTAVFDLTVIVEPLSGLGKKRRYFGNYGKGSHNISKKTSSGLENQRRYRGRRSMEGRCWGGDDCIQREVFPSQIDKIKLESCTFLCQGLILFLYSVQTDVLLLC